ncbi:hypothetical protein PHYPO_G00028450 [Pangasianodon hypophthalmus]|uniref:Uncharacterized protein n=1 Tax=Pangasianodon hypophthalmus TaxID=310915 RepID=A0A5N5MWM9_PANHP|nr:hypothetical protein PHYPO_G00028450 [Pangasianodon hypophthalmus]
MNAVATGDGKKWKRRRVAVAELFESRGRGVLGISLRNDADEAVNPRCETRQIHNPDVGMDCRRKKIALPVGSKAEDTLKTLWMTKDTSGHMCLSDSLSKSCAESPLDGSGSEDSVVSGPSSPSAALHSLRCRKCERLFSKMRRQGPPRKKQRDDDPASLSCDEWLLNKTWQPQRQQQPRGRLWVHLKRIRLRAAKQSDDAMANKAWSRSARDLTCSCRGTCVAAKRCLESHLKAKRSHSISGEIEQNLHGPCAVQNIRERKGSPQRKTIHRSIFHRWISTFPRNMICLQMTTLTLTMRVCSGWRKFPRTSLSVM